MPYQSLNDLPSNVRNHLPRHAQEIYLAAFNHAWEEYSHQEDTAHKVAWSAVKKKYEKNASTQEWQLKG